MYALAIIPGVLLFIMIWRLDSIEREPPKLLFKLFICGALTVISAVLIGFLGDRILSLINKGSGSLILILVDSFIFTALAQEGGKFLVLKLLTWKNREFNYTFDGVVYAVAVSLGFAVAENILYVIGRGADVSVLRLFLSVPGHIFYAIFMGCFYGLARYSKGAGDEKAFKIHIFEAVFIPTVMNGFYISCLRTEKTVYFFIFVIYEILITILAVSQVIRLAREDTIIPGMEWTVLPDNGVWEEDRHEG